MKYLSKQNSLDDYLDYRVSFKRPNVSLFTFYSNYYLAYCKPLQSNMIEYVRSYALSPGDYGYKFTPQSHTFNSWIGIFTFDNDVTSFSFGSNSLHSAGGINQIVLPSTVTSIDFSTTSDSRRSYSDTLILMSTTPPTLSGTVAYDTTRIYVPEESLDIYKAATGWSDYADKIFAHQL